MQALDLFNTREEDRNPMRELCHLERRAQASKGQEGPNFNYGTKREGGGVLGEGEKSTSSTCKKKKQIRKP